MGLLERFFESHTEQNSIDFETSETVLKLIKKILILYLFNEAIIEIFEFHYLIIAVKISYKF